MTAMAARKSTETAAKASPRKPRTPKTEAPAPAPAPEIQDLQGQLASLAAELQELRRLVSAESGEIPAAASDDPPLGTAPLELHKDHEAEADISAEALRPFDRDIFRGQVESALSNIDAMDWVGEDDEDEEIPEVQEIPDDPAAVEAMHSRYPDLQGEIAAFNAIRGGTPLDPEEEFAGFESRLSAPTSEAEPDAEPEPERLPELAPVVDAMPPGVGVAMDEDELAALMAEAEALNRLASASGPTGDGLEMTMTDTLGDEVEHDWNRVERLPDIAAATDSNLATLVPAELAIAALVLPIRQDGSVLTAQAVEPYDAPALAILTATLSVQLDLQPAPMSEVVAGLRKLYGVVEPMSNGASSPELELVDGSNPQAEPEEQAAQEAPTGIKKLLSVFKKAA